MSLPIFQPSAGRELRWFEVFKDCHHPNAFLFSPPIPWYSQPKLSSLGSQLPLKPLPSGQGKSQSHFLVTQRETEVR